VTLVVSAFYKHHFEIVSFHRYIYSALSLSGGTLKDWFVKVAEERYEEGWKPSPFQLWFYINNDSA